MQNRWQVNSDNQKTDESFKASISKILFLKVQYQMEIWRQELKNYLKSGNSYCSYQ